MSKPMAGPCVAIVDFGMGNLFSVRRACERAGLVATLTTAPDDVRAADGVILPGVGGMPDAMRTLREAGLADALLEVAASGKPLFGICLGLQLLMREGTEFERHAGLGIIPGTVVRFESVRPNGRRLKVPHVGWNTVRRPYERADAWDGTPLARVADGVFMYFVHSYYVVPDSADLTVATAAYGDVRFCCAVQRGSVFGCQFHPERSGPEGLRIYKQFASLLRHHDQPQES